MERLRLGFPDLFQPLIDRLPELAEISLVFLIRPAIIQQRNIRLEDSPVLSTM